MADSASDSDAPHGSVEEPRRRDGSALQPRGEPVARSFAPSVGDARVVCGVRDEPPRSARAPIAAPKIEGRNGRWNKRWNELSIATKLPLGVFALLVVVLGGVTVSAYASVRDSSLGAADERLARLSRQLSDMLQHNAEQKFDALRALTAQPILAAHLRAPTEATRATALASLQTYVRATTQALAMELWDAAGERVLVEGTTFPPLERAAFDALVRAANDNGAATRPAGAAGPSLGGAATTGFDQVSDTVLYRALAPIVVDECVDGYVVEVRYALTTQDAVASFSNLLDGARFTIGTPGGIWTNLLRRIDPPPSRLLAQPAMLEFDAADGERVFARAAAVPTTPWIVAIEFASARVLAPVRAFLLRAALLAGGFALLGATVGWAFSRQLTTPLREVADAAESLALGRPTPLVRSSRDDELGRLAASFNSMAREVGQARARLEQLAAHYKLLFDGNPVPMWVCEPDSLAFVDVNAAALAHYGFTRDEFLALSLPALAAPGAPRDERAHGEPAYGERASEQGPRVWLGRHRRADGSAIDVDVTRHAMQLDGRRVELVLALDVSERVAAEHAARDSRAALLGLNAELEQRILDRTAALLAANRDLESFSYSVSHDLRAPLRSIDGFSQALLEDCGEHLDLRGREHLGRVRAAAQRMGELIDDLLQLARLSRAEIRRQRVDVSALARAIVAQLRHEEPERGIVCEIEDGVLADADGRLLRIVLDNLLRNAWKFTGRTRAPRVEFRTMRGDGGVVYCVRDNGAGFDMHYVEKLFRPFQRLHTEAEYAGTGIGLAIVQRIVDRHRGRAWAEGAVGVGACFYFTLDAAPLAAPAAPVAHDVAHALAGARGGGKDGVA